jgi:hypothetical protein
MSYEPTVWADGDHVTSAKLNKLEQGVNSMSYTPTVWNAGDVVTAEKLNKLEQGVAEGGGGGDVVIFTYDDDWSCNMTYAEAKTYWTTYNLNTICPCQKVGISSSWVDMRFADDTMLPSLEAIFDFDADVTEAIVVFSLEGQSTTFHVAYGNNGKLYKPNM